MKVHLPVRKAILNRRTYEAPAEGRSISCDWTSMRIRRAALRGTRALAKVTSKQLAMYPSIRRPRAPGSLLRRSPGRTSAHQRWRTTHCGFFFRHIRRARPLSDLRTDGFPCTATSGIYGCSDFRPSLRQRNGIPAAKRRRKTAQETARLFIANPNNPTGTLFGFKELERILRAATHTAVVMDEAYASFSAFTAVPWIRKFPHLFVARTFSKSPGLPPASSARSSPAKSLSPGAARHAAFPVTLRRSLR